MPKRSVSDPEEAYDLSDEELQQVYTWVDSLTLSRPKRNIHRDFSDGVLMAGKLLPERRVAESGGEEVPSDAARLRGYCLIPVFEGRTDVAKRNGISTLFHRAFHALLLSHR